MLTGSSSSPFASIESVLYNTLFSGHSQYAALTGDLKKPCSDNGSMGGETSCLATRESSENRSSGQNRDQSCLLKAKDESENTEIDDKKSN